MNPSETSDGLEYELDAFQRGFAFWVAPRLSTCRRSTMQAGAGIAVYVLASLQLSFLLYPTS
jgi:hypothetical protein